jgi:hypothetical protein
MKYHEEISQRPKSMKYHKDISFEYHRLSKTAHVVTMGHVSTLNMNSHHVKSFSNIRIDLLLVIMVTLVTSH